MIGATLNRLRALAFVTFFFITIIISNSVQAGSLPWPVKSENGLYRIGNSYGEYQKYDPTPYFHPGIDILVPAGTPVYAVESGYVKAILTLSGKLHWRVAIGDSPDSATCSGWMYAHLRLESIAVNEGDYVEAGQYLGDVVEWPVANFHHLHLSRIRQSGKRWNPNWGFIGNPLDELLPLPDSTAPFFEPAFGKQLFSFCDDETGAYFFEKAPLSGRVDIVCRVGDVINAPQWKVAPYRLSYRIAGPRNIPWTATVTFADALIHDDEVLSVYRADDVCRSYGDYRRREYYFILTNRGGKPGAQGPLKEACWNTESFPNGTYWIYARAVDQAGNEVIDSMQVRVYNAFADTDQLRTSRSGLSAIGGLVVPFLGPSDLAY